MSGEHDEAADQSSHSAVVVRSWEMRFAVVILTLAGLAGLARADEAARVRAHLIHAATALRHHDAGWNPAQLQARHAALAVLDAYIARGDFPRRTDDPYGALRPRFIDDRGVHCAVGALIAASGRDDLAHQIAATDEYAFVRDIQVPALAQWAAEHGFSVDELAMIQPSYSAPPTLDSTRRQIKDATERYTITCAARATPDPTVVLHIVATHDDRTTVTAKTTTPFARCFASEAATAHYGGGAYRGSPEAYDTDITITIPSVQKLFEGYVAQQEPQECSPRPGPIVRRVIMDLTGDSVKVKTVPANDEVETCIADHAWDLVHRFTGISDLHGHREFAFHSPFEAGQLRPRLVKSVADAATDCYGKTGPARVKASVRAHVDDAHPTITTDAEDPVFGRCVSDKVAATIRGITVARHVGDDKWERYFRIDRDIDLTVDVGVETPAHRKARGEAMRKKYEHMRDEANR
jgi:hypothetical protein